jgi:carboxylesterase
MAKTLERINQAVWELREKVRLNPASYDYRKDLLNFWTDSKIFVERRSGVPEPQRSFLMLQKREAVGCLLIHGAGGTPEEMRPMAEYLFRQGFTVLGIRLPLDPNYSDAGFSEYTRAVFSRKGRKARSGGGADAGGSWSACIAQSEVALDTLLAYSPDSYVAGFSFGGTIALNLMQKFPVKGTILLSPGLFPMGGTRFAMFWAARRFLPGLTKKAMPVRTMMLDLLERTRSSLGSEPINTPMLVIQAADDPVISARGYQFLQKRASNPRSKFILMGKGGHVIVKGDDSLKVFGHCSDFIKGV